MDCLDAYAIATTILSCSGNHGVALVQDQIEEFALQGDPEGAFVWELVLDALMVCHRSSTDKSGTLQ